MFNPTLYNKQQYISLILFKMAIKRVRRFFSELDFFAANATLRQNKQPYSATPCLGVMSLCLLAFFIYLLITNLSNIINLNGDALKVTESFESDNEVRNITNLMFGVSIAIKGVAFEKVPNYFTTYAMVGDQRIILVPCQAQQWILIGKQYKNSFYSYSLHNSYCPQKILNIEVKNSYENFISIYIDQCNMTINPKCLNNSQFNQFMQNFYAGGSVVFPFWINFLTPVADVNAVNPIKYFVDYKRLSISKTQSTVANIKFDKFKVSTDTSFWPVAQQISEVSVFTPGELSIANVPKQYSEHLLVTNLYLSQNVAVYVRKIRKIDDLLSYLGGLLGIIVLMISFLVSGYNIYRYELKVAESTFNYNNEGIKMREKDLNAWVYIKYLVFLALNVITRNRIKWKNCLAMKQTLTQSRELLNVEKLFNRLEFLEDFIWSFVNEDQLKVMALVELQSIDQVRRKRYSLEYFKAITKLQRSPTFEQVVDEKNSSVNDQIKALIEIHAVRSNKWKKKKPQFQLDFDHEETVEEIVQSLMNDLNIKNQTFCEKIAQYQSLATEAKHLQLNSDLVALQKIIIRSFLDLSVLSEAVVQNIIRKIPIIILHRLRFRAMEIKKNRVKQKIKIAQRPSALSDLLQSLGVKSSDHIQNIE